MNTRRTRLSQITRSGVSLAALAAACGVIATPALAQNATPPAPNAGTGAGQPTQLNEIVVTARRTSENLQQVPTAVTAMSAQELAAKQITSFATITNDVPNVNFQPQFGDPSTPFVTIRGFSNGSLNTSVDNPIGMYIDDVYIGRAVGAAFDLADISQLEVLRGPQGTLFGRNVTGGAMVFRTQGPSGQADAHLEATFGNYDHYRGKVTVDTPEWNGLSARFAYLHDSNNGYVTNTAGGTTTVLPQPFGAVTAGNSFGSSKTDAASMAIRYTGIDHLKLDFRADYSHQVAMQLGTQALGFTSTEAFEQGFAAFSGIPVSTSRLSSLSLPFMTPGTLSVGGASLVAQYEINPTVTFKNIVAYRKLDQDTGGNEIDGGRYDGGYLGYPAGTPFTVISGINHRTQHQWSEEAQLLGSTPLVNWVVGLFYWNEQGGQNGPVFVFNPETTAGLATAIAGGTTTTVGGAAPYTVGALDQAHNQSIAAYAHAVVHLNDQWDIAGGFRFSHDMKDYTHITPNTTLAQNSFTTLSAKFSNPDWDASLTYKITPDVNVYGKVATGYLSGGALGNSIFQPEKNTSYEVGLKSELFDRKLRANISAFYQQVDNLQFTEFNVTSGSFILNGSSVDIPGVEVELTAIPMEGLTLNATYGHQRVPVLTDPASGQALHSLYPSDNASLSGEYRTQPIWQDAYVSARIEGVYTSSHLNNSLTLGTGTAADLALQQAITTPAEWNVNGRISLADVTMAGKRGRISFWVNNLTNNHNLAFARDLSTIVVGQFEIPRTYGVDLSLDF